MLIETADLDACLDDDDMRVIDCNIAMAPKPEGGYEIRSGKENVFICDGSLTEWGHDPSLPLETD